MKNNYPSRFYDSKLSTIYYATNNTLNSIAHKIFYRRYNYLNLIIYIN